MILLVLDSVKHCAGDVFGGETELVHNRVLCGAVAEVVKADYFAVCPDIFVPDIRNTHFNGNFWNGFIKDFTVKQLETWDRDYFAVQPAF